MLELGQPMHAFDKDFIKSINVKTLKEKQEFVTLDDTKRELDVGTLMICNDDTPVAIAGVMGGQNTQITDNTTSLFLESANFNAVTVRKTASKLALRTDASARYEKTLDPELTKIAVERFVKVLKDEDKNVSVSSSFSDLYVNKYPEIHIDISKEYINKKIGVEFTLDKIVDVLTSLEFIVDIKDKENITIHVPSFRATKDVSGKADIIEEISRIYGYDNIVPQTNLWKVEPVREDETRVLEYNSKKLLAEKYGMSEIHSYVWYDTKLNNELGIKTHDNLKIVNGLNRQDSVLRYNMSPTMLYSVYKNIKNYDEFGIFEIGRVFDYKEKSKECEEYKVLAIALTSTSKSDDNLLYSVKSMIENIAKINKNINLEYVENTEFNDNYIHPVNSFVIKYNNTTLGYISSVNPRVKDKINQKANIVIAELNIELLSQIEANAVIFKEISRYQTVDFDFSIIVDKNVKYQDIENVINNSNLEYLQSYKLVDVYENEEKLKNKKNITIRFTIGSYDKTLTKDEIDNARNKLITNLGNNNMVING
jgi:phenylalanyl-tRNA synthetase beta chain